MTVAELRNTMSNGEFIQWVAFYNLESQRREIEQNKATGKTRG